MAKLKREEIEVALLQETHLSDSEHENLKKWRFSQYTSSYRQGSKRVVVILISRKLSFECIYEKKDPDGSQDIISKIQLHWELDHISNSERPERPIKIIQLKF